MGVESYLSPNQPAEVPQTENVTVEVLTVRLITRVSSPTGPPLVDNLFWRDSINKVQQHGGRPPPPLSVGLCRPTTGPQPSPLHRVDRPRPSS